MSNNIKDHKFIIFCVDHYNPLGMCRSLGEKGINPIVVLIAEHPVLINHCRYVHELHKVSTIEEGYNLILKNFGSEKAKPFLMTCSDDTTEYLDQHYDEINGKFYFFNGGGKGVISRYMDKETICNVAEECGIPKPKGEVLKRDELPKTLRYPIITKVTMSIKGAWKGDVHICKNEEELKKVWPLIKADEILAQEFIIKKNELCVDGFSINGGEEIWFPNTSEYIRFTEEGYGNYMWIKPYTDETIRTKIRNIIKKTHFSGIFSLECLIDQNDNLYFLEVNFRNSTWSYAYTYGGLNLPYQWALSTLNGKIDYSSCKVRTTPFIAIVEPEDFSKSVKSTHSIGMIKWLKQCFTADCHFYYNKKDLKPLFYFVLRSLLKKI